LLSNNRLNTACNHSSVKISLILPSLIFKPIFSPFRTIQQASSSKIKNETYTVQDALHCVEELKKLKINTDALREYFSLIYD